MHQRIASLIVVSLLLLLCQPHLANAAPAKHEDNATQQAAPAWRWSDEERLTARFDPMAMKARAARAAATGDDAQLGTHSSGAKTSDTTDRNIIIGKHNPELFLPFELFGYLIKDGFAIDPQQRTQFRERIEPMIADSKPGEQFWDRLETASRPFIEQQQHHQQLARQLNTAESDDERAQVRRSLAVVQERECELRHEALVASTAAIGREQLLRVLYTAIAPTISSVSKNSDTKFALTVAAGGCK
ncbi:MAG: hypothetical protein ACSLFQ_02145 [Thermoanaerobaculia bacterium]